jgi:hypothetical protein
MRSHRGIFREVLLYALRAAGAAQPEQTTVNASLLEAVVESEVR